jgi:hypothetical protein
VISHVPARQRYGKAYLSLAGRKLSLVAGFRWRTRYGVPNALSPSILQAVSLHQFERDNTDTSMAGYFPPARLRR